MSHQVEYLSPSSIKTFFTDKKEFYLRYMALGKPDRIPQTRPMSIGSAFDAYVKSYLHENLFGKDNDPKYSFDNLFTAQVEAQNRDWAKEHGAYVFGCYKASGALADLMIELGGAQGAPRFEFDIHGAVNGYKEGVTLDVGAVILFGKPDVHFKNKSGHDVILDWKVNGYCSKASPAKGYVKLRGGKSSGPHKDAFVQLFNGMFINICHKLEAVDEDWADQLAIYGWLLGMPIGSEFITAIDQLACNSDKCPVDVRVAEHRTTVSPEHQHRLFAKAQEVWEVVHSDHFFRELSYEESKRTCEVLDKMGDALRGNGSEQDKLFAKWSRG